MLWSLVSLLVSTLIGALVLKLVVWIVAPRAPNGLLRAVAVNFAMGLAVLAAGLLGVGLSALAGFIGAAVAFLLIILAPVAVLRMAYGVGTLRAVVLVVLLAVCHLALNRVTGRFSGHPTRGWITVAR